MNKSIWFFDSKNTKVYSTDRKKAEIIVIGAGLTGLLTAWQLCQEGRDVLVLEAREIGSGTSGYTTGKITSQHSIIYQNLIDDFGYDKAKLYADSNQWAVQAFIDLINKEGINCHLHEHPAYIYTDDDINILNKENEAALSLGLPSSMEPVSISQNKALCFRSQAQFHPRQFMSALADKIISRGSAIAEHKRIIDFNEDNKKCVIKTKNESYESDYIVIATLFPIQDHLFYAMRLKPVLHHAIAYSYEKKEFDGMFIGEKGFSFRYYEDYLIVVGADIAMGDNDEIYQKLDYKARKKFSVKEIKTHWSAHDLQSPDIIPFIGPYHPGVKRIFTATGFEAWGISHAMVASKIISDLIAGRNNSWASLYSPTRTNKVLPAMIERSQVALKSIIKKGKRCTHMGCGLVFNNADRTYDCPCHGSRFDEEGNILWGPAVKKIKG